MLQLVARYNVLDINNHELKAELARVGPLCIVRLLDSMFILLLLLQVKAEHDKFTEMRQKLFKTTQHVRFSFWRFHAHFRCEYSPLRCQLAQELQEKNNEVTLLQKHLEQVSGEGSSLEADAATIERIRKEDVRQLAPML